MSCTAKRNPGDVTVLGIETSCDETAAAVVRGGRHVLSSVVASQDELHEEYGGVVPEIASRAHLERIYPVVQHAMEQAQIGRDGIDAIAVGHRPGLIGSLLVGVAAAKALAWAWERPIIGVDHIVAHLHAVSLDTAREPEFPAIGLVVSGGHTSLFAMRSALEVECIGRTIDDAIGEAYDKAAAILGLGYPGGPRVDSRAQRGDDRAHDFPVARLEPGSLDFSFSGLKTALLYAVRGTPTGRGAGATFERDATHLTGPQIDDLCASFQKAAVGAVMLKLDRAIGQRREAGGEMIRSIIIGGGVSANTRLRSVAQALADRLNLSLHLPAMTYCLDNAAMIAGLGCLRLEAGLVDDLSLTASPAGLY